MNDIGQAAHLALKALRKAGRAEITVREIALFLGTTDDALDGYVRHASPRIVKAKAQKEARCIIESKMIFSPVLVVYPEAEGHPASDAANGGVK